MKAIISYFKLKLREEYTFFKQLNKSTGIGMQEYVTVKMGHSLKDLSLFGKKIKASDAFWHLHSVHEIFIDEVYKFRSTNPKPLILDCGSNVGLSIIYFKKLYPHAKVIGFEPDPHIFDMLKHNISQFGYSDVDLINKAIWIDERELTFNSTGALGGTLDLNGANGGSEENRNKVKVKTVRLREYLLNQKVDFLKIDVEGAEFELMDDCIDVLHNVDHLFIEYHRTRNSGILLGDFVSKLENCGFRVYVKEAWNNLPNPYCFNEFNPMYDLQLNIFAYRM